MADVSYVSYVVATSHRARAKLHRLVVDRGGNHAEFFRMDRDYHITEIPATMAEDACKIRGIRRAPRSAPEGWRRCWSSA